MDEMDVKVEDGSAEGFYSVAGSAGGITVSAGGVLEFR